MALRGSVHNMRNETLEIVSETRTIRHAKMPTNKYARTYPKIVLKVSVFCIVLSIVLILNNLFCIVYGAQK